MSRVAIGQVVCGGARLMWAAELHQVCPEVGGGRAAGLTGSGEPAGQAQSQVQSGALASDLCPDTPTWGP